MKKIVMMAALIVAIAFTANAQIINASKVPTAVKETFAKQFPGATAKWEKETGDYEAGFKLNGKTMSAQFEPSGTMIESEVDIKPSELPANILAYITKHYKGKKIKEGAKITKTDGTVNYEAEVNGKDVIFDVDGNFLKEVKA